MKRVALITGTRKGLGKHLAERFLANGYDVIGCSRQPGTLEHPSYRHVCFDVADEAAAVAAVSDIAKTYGRLDVLVNNAGVASMNHSMMTPMKTVRDLFATNVFGTFALAREASKIMRKNKWGRIVNFSTVAVPLRLEGEAAYAASKAAVEALTRIWARELAPFGITVNAVGPTPVLTDLIRAVPRDKIQQLIARQAIQRMGEEPDVSNVVEFFCSEQSSFVTGQVVYLGGVS